MFHGIYDGYKNQYSHPEIFNTDQGSQYTSEIHTQRLKNLGITISMDGRGRATDNICIERFWRSAKVERIYLNEYQNIPKNDNITLYNKKKKKHFATPSIGEIEIWNS